MCKEYFFNGLSDWNNHIPLLWLALEETGAGDVIEMGCGDGSTPQLHAYCQEKKRTLYSFETDEHYMKKFIELHNKEHVFTRIINDWHVAKDRCPDPSVILIDHAPGERRIVDVKRFADIKGILVLHDTQPPPTAADYGWENIWHLFKYKVHLDAGKNEDPAIPDNRTWASAVSNHHDVAKWRGLKFKNDEYVLK